ncbi:uncharacterized protein LOC123313822 isoform X2 [Coccinella septempunctata]|uniref:uncharacterized protein LOC123313822 isoform X2 n=1 Tax=Coccinella septempunctata TaxID=41139 RepID=UPI001D06D275|nr:uncharacterized protein LOC123313822 isoform X2 [Coccinella septempunctata]
MKLNQGILILKIFILSILTIPECYGYLKVNFNKERDTICSKIRLLGIGVSAYLLRQHDNSGLLVEGDFHIHSNTWKDDLVCTFKVGYPSGTDGVIAVIQSLTMRRNNTSGKCIDFIQFEAKDSSKSNPFCGHFNVVSKMSGEANLVDDFNFGNSFRTKRHKMHVHIIFGREPNCSPETLNDLTYRPCSDKSSFCIYDGFFNDGYVNCPLPGCVDEGSCLKFVTLEKVPTIGTKLLVSSLSFLSVLFITFLISIWACKKHKVACFSDHFSHPSRMRQNRDTEMYEQGTTRSTQRDITPNAPPIEIDKDLPPKYEDLFPDR